MALFQNTPYAGELRRRFALNAVEIVRDLRDQRDLGDHDIDRLDAMHEAMLHRVRALLTAGKVRTAIALIDVRLPPGGAA